VKLGGRFSGSLRAGEALVGVALLLLAVAVAWTGWRMPRGDGPGIPGPGFMPWLLGLLLAMASAALLAQLWRRRGEERQPVSVGGFHIWLSLLALIGLALALEPLGYIISAAVFLCMLFRAFSSLGWAGSIAAAVAAALVSHAAFVRLLGVTLPPGIL
jgi:putative tricarboxylic transport membrane protein